MDKLRKIEWEKVCFICHDCKRLLPSMYIITWNVATRSPDADISDLLNLKRNENDSLPDFYIIGLQEVKAQPQNFVIDALFNDPWTNVFKTALAAHDYVKVKTSRLVGLVLNIFCLRKHVVHLRDIYTEQTRTGLMGFWGNKGAVTIRMQIYGCSICMINCHLSPHDSVVNERIDDYNAILQQKFSVKDTTTIFYHDYVFWFGDLNFRLVNPESLSAEEIVRKIQSNQTAALLEYDELKRVMANGEAFSELTENGPTFQPTYKYNFYSQDYDLKRRPAWTDRILYKVNKFAYENVTLDIEQMSYRSCDQYTLSDHKPVLSELHIKVFSDYTERQVEITPLGIWSTEIENKVLIQMESDVTPSQWDWIGIYHDDFTSLDDFVHYVYMPAGNDAGRGEESTSQRSKSSAEQPAQIVITIPDTAIRVKGVYRLLYFTQHSDSVLGMSRPFEVEEPSPRVPMDW